MLKSRVTTFIIILVAASIASGSEHAASIGTQAALPEPGQFGNHVWTDVDGNPLPFQRDAGLEDFLASAKVTEKAMVNEGITMPRRLELTKDGISAHAIFKDVDIEANKVTERTAGRSHFYLDWRDSYVYENAALVVDRMLGLNRVPPAALRKYGNSTGIMIMWIEGTMTEEKRQKKGLAPPDRGAWHHQLQVMHIFNNLIAKRDLNLGNILIDQDWRLWFIDSSRSFGTGKELLYPEAILFCPPDLWESLRNLDPELVRQELKPFLSKSEIKAFLARRDKIVQHLDKLIDQHGENQVIFDMMDEEHRIQQAQNIAR